MPAQIRQLRTTDADFETEFARLRHWSAETDQAIEQRVAAILDDVRARGDAAVLEYTARFDGLQAASVGALELTREELKAAFDAITPAQRSALEAAARRVRSYHERQLEACGRSWQYRDEDGTLLGQKVTPIDRVGIYVPGGKAAYPSSVLMSALPAHVAGVGEIVMVVPTPRGERNALVLAAAYVSGVHARSRSAAPRPSRRWRTAPRASPPSTRSRGRATPMSRAPNGASSGRSAST
jgi:histidinol dehydrogenase